MSDLGDYLCNLFLEKFDQYLNFQEVEFSEEEILHIHALALNSTFNGANKSHPYTTEN